MNQYFIKGELRFLSHQKLKYIETLLFFSPVLHQFIIINIIIRFKALSHFKAEQSRTKHFIL